MAKLSKRVKAQQDALRNYCKAIGWMEEKLVQTLYSTGISTESIYIDGPNDNVLDVLAEFLTITGSSILLVHGPNGFGKSALKEFALRTLVDNPQFFAFSIDSPGTCTPFALAKQILNGINPESAVPRSKGAVLGAIEQTLIATREAGRIIILFVDEGQQLTLDQIGILRAIADVKTPAGDLTIKLIILGTPALQNHIVEWLQSHPEEAGAFDDRCGFSIATLKKWDECHIQEWLSLVCQFAAGATTCTNPFAPETITLISTVSEGKPRSIVQLAQMALNHRALQYSHAPQTGTSVSEEDVRAALSKRG
jgi:type II secretory pathway predicted ATPase ExeA